MTSPIVFLSYSHEDLEAAVELAAEIRARGLRTWQDTKAMRLGEKFEAQLREGIDSADGVVFYTTPNSLRSEWVKRVEVPHAKRQTPSFKLMPVFHGFRDFDVARIACIESLGFDLTEYYSYRRSGVSLDPAEAASYVLRSFFEPNGDGTREVLNLGLHGRQVGPGDRDLDIDLTEWLGDEPGTEADWERIWIALLDLSDTVSRWSSCRRIHVTGVAHLSAAFALGMAFPAPSRFQFSVEQGGSVWNQDSDRAHEMVLRTDWGDLKGRVITVEVSVSRDVRADVDSYLQGLRISPRARLQVSPIGSPGRDSLNGASASTLANDIVGHINALRAELQATEVMFFLACPMALALFLGASVNAMGSSVRIHEFDQGLYHQSLVVHSGRAR